MQALYAGRALGGDFHSVMFVYKRKVLREPIENELRWLVDTFDTMSSPADARAALQLDL